MQNDFYDKLSQLALKRSIPYCMGCHKEAKDGRCLSCGSDDLGFLLPGCSCGWGLDWIIEEILKECLTPVDLAEAFEQSVRESYPETVQVAWMNLDVCTVCQEIDPVSWNIAKGEWEDQECEAGTIVTFDGGTYYWAYDLEAL
ncbi:MAG: hypothetical protein HYV97_06080 [Bdellovibrio sp.]|nr:hypothetical protein [Bdellovibrio sp.]